MYLNGQQNCKSLEKDEDIECNDDRKTSHSVKPPKQTFVSNNGVTEAAHIQKESLHSEWLIDAGEARCVDGFGCFHDKVFITFTNGLVHIGLETRGKALKNSSLLQEINQLGNSNNKRKHSNQTTSVLRER
jgi:hypothetical protein